MRGASLVEKAKLEDAALIRAKCHRTDPIPGRGRGTSCEENGASVGTQPHRYAWLAPALPEPGTGGAGGRRDVPAVRGNLPGLEAVLRSRNAFE